MLHIITYSVLLILILGGCTKPVADPTTAPAKPEPVEALRIAPEPYLPANRYLARVQASATADIRPQVSGIVTAQHFEEGRPVIEGQPLYDIDRQPYDAAVELGQARVAAAEAALAIASLRAERTRTLRASSSVSQQELDETSAELMQARAQRDIALAMLKQAEIDLHNCVIRSPIAGVIGQSNVTVGALVSASQPEVLASVQRLQPIWVDIQRPLNDQLRNDGKGAEVTLVLEDGTELKDSGRVRLVESRVNLSTNSVLTRAEFANADGRLLPGMRAEAVMTSADEQQAIFIPQRSLRRLPSGEGQVMLVNQHSRIELRTVELAETVNGRWRVTAGLMPGEIIIASGLQKLQADMQVDASLQEKQTFAKK